MVLFKTMSYSNILCHVFVLFYGHYIRDIVFVLSHVQRSVVLENVRLVLWDTSAVFLHLLQVTHHKDFYCLSSVVNVCERMMYMMYEFTMATSSYVFVAAKLLYIISYYTKGIWFYKKNQRIDILNVLQICVDSYKQKTRQKKMVSPWCIYAFLALVGNHWLTHKCVFGV